MRLELNWSRDNGTRHYLGGKPVHCGSQIELYLPSHPDGPWVRGRYEAGIYGRRIEAELFIPASNGGRHIHKITAADEFRWPQHEEASA
jgi:hypothetical protein